MDFDLVEIASDPCLGAAENDDCASFVQTAASVYAWVIDGGTSVAETNYLGAEVGDVAWFSQALSAAMKIHAGRELSAKALHGLAAAEVALAYDTAVGNCRDGVPLYAKPIAAVTIVRIVGSGDHCRLDLFHLADCPAFVMHNAGEVTRITEHENVEAEIGLKARVVASQTKHGFEPKAVLGEQLPWLRERREAQLRADSLSISTPTPGCAFGGWEKTVALANADAIVLMSDGFERYAAEYALGDDRDMVLATLRDGAGQVLRQVRDLEHSDPACRAFPRLKVSDDATCLVLRRTGST